MTKFIIVPVHARQKLVHERQFVHAFLSALAIAFKPSAKRTIFIAEDEDFHCWGRRCLSLATKLCCVRETHIKDFCRWRRSSISNMQDILFRRWWQKTRSLLPVTKIVPCALGFTYLQLHMQSKICVSKMESFLLLKHVNYLIYDKKGYCRVMKAKGDGR